MTAKTLLSLVGDAYNLGDVIYTRRTTTPDGKTLLECDGTVVSGTYPLLQALLPISCAIAPARVWVADDGTQHNTIQNAIEVPNTTNDVMYIYPAGGNYGKLLDAAYTASALNTGDNFQAAGLSISASGTGCVITSLEASTVDFEIFATIAGTTPSVTPISIHTAAHILTTGWSIMNPAGTVAIVGAWTGTVMNVHTSGANITTGYSSTDIFTPVSHSVPSVVYQAVSTDDLTKICLATGSGLFFSDDSGASWTEPSKPQGAGTLGTSNIMMDEDGDVMAMYGKDIYKTTDQGVNWTLVLDYHDIAAGSGDGLHSVATPRMIPTSIGSHAANKWTVIGWGYVSDMGGGVSQEDARIFCAYTEDSGATWAYNVMDSQDPTGAGLITSLYTQQHTSLLSPSAFSRDGTRYVQMMKLTAVYKTFQFDLTPGVKVRPYKPGYKIVADKV